MGDEDAKKPPVTPEAQRAREAQKAFERVLEKTGEAAEADEHGQLPPGATHEIIGHDSEGKPIYKRRRYSAT